MIIDYLFLVFAFVCAFCVWFSRKLKRKNPGYMFAAIIMVLSNVVCFILLVAKDADKAHVIMPVYYILHAWAFFAVIVTLNSYYFFNDYIKYLAGSAAICVYQTVIAGSHFFGKHLLVISDHVFFNKRWWIGTPAEGGYLFSFRIYNDLCIVNIIIICYVIIRIMRHSAGVFRSGFGAMIVSQVTIGITFLLTNSLSLPIWIYCIGANMVCFMGFYLVNFYFEDKMKTWALSSFANDMSDGFILYNEYNDMIHMNGVIRELLPRELAASFQDRKNIDEWMRDTVRINKTDVQHCRKVNKELYFITTCTDLSVEHKKYGVMYIIHDTTESIMEMDTMKKANEELERAAKMKSDFLANMSHEIRTPMNAVIGMAEIALREDLPDNVRDYLLQIQNSGRSLLGIINDILDFSKIESGKMDILPERYELLPEMNEIAGVLMTRIGEKPLELFVITDGYIPRALEGDLMRIRQIIINLAGNAIKFTKHGMVKIHITGEKVSSEEVKLTCHVVDTGQGIKEEDLGKLFVSFQQVDSRRNRSVEGTGLGLAISQKLCEAMGGTMGVKSEYGKGSDFFFTIPQKILDPETDLVVEKAEEKRVVCLNKTPDAMKLFSKAAERYGIDSEMIGSLSEYTPCGKKDYIFFEEGIYESQLRGFLDKNPEVTGVVLVKYDSAFVSDQKNLRVMRRPETTLNMVTILNDKEMVRSHGDDKKAFVIDFKAPEARILIVDDNPINITIAGGLLEPLGAQIFSAESGMKALEMAGSDSFDIIFMDHMMPEMDGIETTHEIRRKIPSAKTTPIIALTANAMEGARDMFIKAGMNDLVTKPVDVKDIISAVKRWLPSDKVVDVDASDVAGGKGEASDLVEYEGLDVAGAISAIGMASLYNKIVEEYYRSGKNKHNEISSAYDTENWEDYTIKVHALKSSSRQIGALPLGDLAESLEKAGKAGDLEKIHADTARLLDDYSALLNTLSSYFPEEEAPSPEDLPEISDDELKTLLDDLVTACDNLDMDEMERVRDELKSHSLPEEVLSFADSLYQAIDNLDTDACLEAVEGIRAAHFA